MILSCIIIFLLLSLSYKLGYLELRELDFWQTAGLTLLILIVVWIDHLYYQPDYDKIRRIVEEELRRERKREGTN